MRISLFFVEEKIFLFLQAAAHIHRYLNIDAASLQLSSDPAEGKLKMN